jgi:hypothetical protein
VSVVSKHFIILPSLDGFFLHYLSSALCPLGLPNEISANLLALGEGLLKLLTLPQNTLESNLAYCESGWILIGTPLGYS